MKMERQTVFSAITGERDYQDSKWGAVDLHGHEVGAWLLLMRQKLEVAANEWASRPTDHEALVEIRKVLGLGVACCEQHGVPVRVKTVPLIRMRD